MAGCSCTSGVGNFGIPNCLPLNEIPVGFLFQRTFDSAGARNFLDGTLIGDVAYLQDLAYSADELVRLYPLQDIAEGVSERGDSTFYEDSLGVSHFIREGQRTYVGEKVTKATPKLVGKVQSMQCVDMSVYVVGHKGGIFGDTTIEGQLFGYEIVAGTMDARWVFATSAKPAHIPLVYTIADDVEDQNIMKFDAGDIGDNARTIKGLQDVDGAIDGVVSITEWTIDLKTQYGTAKAFNPLTGAVIGDFVLTETSPTPGITTITSVVEDAVVAGKYLFTVTSTSADVNVLTGSATLLGKGYALAPVTVTTP